MGGSDSDALGATSAVNKSNTSESAGDSPSSASDQEEITILEELSVCSPIQACILSKTFHGKLGSILTFWLSCSGFGSSGASLEAEVCLLSSQLDQYSQHSHNA